MDANADEKETSLKFHEFGLDDRVLEAIARLGWVEPTLIQEKAIPLFLKGKDILAKAQTGSGKTGAYLVPLIHTILEKKLSSSKQVTHALILAPSKELCKQISEHIQQLTCLCKREVRCIDISPQATFAAQLPLLADNPDIIVGTPDKILFHIKQGHVDFTKALQYVIIDEADLMFAFSYTQELQSVLRKVPKFYQSFITSATLPDDVNELKGLVTHNPVVLKLQEPPFPSGEKLTHYVVHSEDFDKAIMLYALLKLNVIRGKTLIFCNTVDKCYKIRMFLSMFDLKCCVLNAELPLMSRCHILDQFNRNMFTILVASDVQEAQKAAATSDKRKFKKRKADKDSRVSRGIDFQYVANVINYDFPLNASSYIHRVGRTARASLDGTAISLVSSKEQKMFKDVTMELKELVSDCEFSFKDYNCNMVALDGFRYRASDAWKQCTTIATKDVRKKEIQIEILKSRKLKTFFDDRPKDLEIIRHDVGGQKGIRCQPHLKNVPSYNVPAALKRVAAERKKRKLGRKPLDTKKSKANYLKKMQDPLRCLRFEGFK